MWIGKFILGLLGLGIGGFPGFLVGLLAGHLFDSFAEQALRDIAGQVGADSSDLQPVVLALAITRRRRALELLASQGGRPRFRRGDSRRRAGDRPPRPRCGRSEERNRPLQCRKIRGIRSRRTARTPAPGVHAAQALKLLLGRNKMR